MRQLLRRLSFLLNRRRLEREMAEEMAYHREQMAPDRRALFGDDLRLREDAREMWGWTWLDRLQQDVSYGVRVLRGAPGFTLTAVLVLVLGIGVPLTALRIVVADVPGVSAPDPDTLVQLTRRSPSANTTTLAYPELAFYSENAKSFREVIGVSQQNLATFDAAAGSAPERVRVAFVTANYFAEFGVVAALGRTFSAHDERPGAETVAMLDASFWTRRFGEDPGVVGQVIRINEKAVRVVGVLPRTAQSRDDVWMPVVQQPAIVDGSTMLSGWTSALTAYGRLAPGVSPGASQQETLTLARSLRERWPDRVATDEYLEARPILQFDADTDAFAMWMTAGALVLLLLVAACANLGTLVLARGVAREREIRVRMALGAGRLRVVRQLFTESVLLAMVSGGAALLLSTLVLKAFQVQLDITAPLMPDWRTVATTFTAAMLAAVVFGLPAAFRLASLVPRAGHVRRVFLGTQVAVSCLLLVVSSLLVSNRDQLGAAEPGFDYRQLVWVSPGLRSHGYTDPAAQAYLDQLRERVAAMPGVTTTSQTRLGPWDDLHMSAGSQGRQIDGNQVDSQFLGTMGIDLLRGRNFDEGETAVALVNEATARLLWPGEDAIGKTLPWAPTQTVIGVVENASTVYVGKPDSLEYYVPRDGAEIADGVLLVRVSGSPRDVVRALHDAARGLDARLQPVVTVVTDTYDREVKNASTAMGVIAGLGIVANLLSIVGLAGLAGYTVAKRTREIAVRIALGARASHVVRGILAPMGRPIGIGFLLGALGGAAVGNILRNGNPLMASLNVGDPLPYLMALIVFAGVVGVSILSPSRRATRIDPLQALKGE
jgi:macrolide transport system ATP-binding/permease protein